LRISLRFCVLLISYARAFDRCGCAAARRVKTIAEMRRTCPVAATCSARVPGRAASRSRLLLRESRGSNARLPQKFAASVRKAIKHFPEQHGGSAAARAPACIIHLQLECFVLQPRCGRWRDARKLCCLVAWLLMLLILPYALLFCCCIAGSCPCIQLSEALQCINTAVDGCQQRAAVWFCPRLLRLRAVGSGGGHFGDVAKCFHDGLGAIGELGEGRGEGKDGGMWVCCVCARVVCVCCGWMRLVLCKF